MRKYEVKKFNIGGLKGISQETIDEHLKLYEGYVNNTNVILDELNKKTERTYSDSEMQRRLGFEFGGMKNHELYFESLSDNAKEINKEGELFRAVEEEWGSFEDWLISFKSIAKTRGVGWAILYYDKSEKRLINCWIDEQHLGHLANTTQILALDMWEHSFVFDYKPSGKGKYIEDFFENLNWSKVEDVYISASQ